MSHGARISTPQLATRVRGAVGLATAALAILIIAAAFLVIAGTSPDSVQRTVLLLGQRTLESNLGFDQARGVAGFTVTAAGSGLVETARVYIGRENRATSVSVGIYADAGGNPSAQLTSGSRTHLVPGAWNSVPLRSARVHVGWTYWIVVLAHGGPIAYRDHNASTCPSDVSGRANLVRLPLRWHSEPVLETCKLSAYVTGRGGSSAHAVATTAQATPAANASTRAARPKPGVGCAALPSRCGYPDRTNTGVPTGTPLTPSGAIQVEKVGTVISGLDVNGTIRVMANDVTIKDTRVSASYPQGAAVFVAQNVSGTMIEDSTIRGQDARTNSVGYAILNAGWPLNASTIVRRVQMYNCAECYNGPGTVEDSYANASAAIDGAHYEDVFYGGGSLLTLRHDTLLNPHPQTAVVYTEPDAGPVSNVTIADNLVAGGGWTIYGGGGTSIDFKVTNNRFSTMFYRKIGHFGLDTAVHTPQTTWTGNYSDASGEALSG